MRINFRQGVVSHQSSGNVQTFLNINGAGGIDLVTNNRSATFTIAHKATDYLITEDRTISSAWTGPFPLTTRYWLYVDINPQTSTRTFGSTTIEPIVQTTQPISGTDSYGVPILTDGRHWYDNSTHKHYVLMGSVWREVLRVFVTSVYANHFYPLSDTPNSFVGTQIGDNNSVKSGRILTDETSKPIKRDDGTFFTTESQFFADASRVDALRLESNVSRAQLGDASAAAFTPVAWKNNGKIETAQYDDIGTTVIGLLTEDLLLDESGAVIIQGTITNVDWNWTASVDIGSSLWVENGALVTEDPHVLDPFTYPYGRVPVARVLGQDTIIFEQGLGGKGEKGDTGAAGDLAPATTSVIGAVRLSYPASIPELPVVITDTDPRITNPTIPAHTHVATSVSYSPAGGLTSNNVQLAIEELGNGKLNLSGGTLTDFLMLHADPTDPLQASTKQYVDSLASGLVWLDPICTVNMISDNVATPPGAPISGDSYIIPAGATGAWSAITEGNIVAWDGAVWVDRGPILNFNPAGPRFGIALQSTTPASGTFAGHENEIALYDSSGSFTGFEVPTANNALYACSASDLFAYNQYVFSGTEWILFGGGASLTPDGTTLVQTGNVLSVKQFADGGIVDATYWQGLIPTDLDTVYAPMVHTHPSSSMAVTPYTGTGWGTPADTAITNITSTDVQSALEELQDEKAPKLPFYSVLADLPAASSVHGMIVYVDSQKRPYFSSDGVWLPVATSVDTPNIPYDMAFFVSGTMQIDKIVGSFAITRSVTVIADAINSVALCSLVATDAPYTLDIVHRTGPTYTKTVVGTVTFAVGVYEGVISFPSTVIMGSGDLLQLVTDSVAIPDANLADLSVTIVGCAATTIC